MVETEDWLLRYGVILGKRYTEKQKKKFLRSASKEFQSMGYNVAVTRSEVSVLKTEKKSFYNLYAGDLKKADVVFATYYDTPVKSFNLYRQTAFQNQVPRLAATVHLFVLVALIVLAGALFYYGLLPGIYNKGLLSLPTVGTVVLALLFFYLIMHFRSGIPNRVNMTRNTSSLLTLLQTANELPKKQQKRVAFALIDGGTTTDYGSRMLKDALGSSRAPIVFLDSVGNTGPFQWFTSKTMTLPAEDQQHPLSDDQKELGDILLTAGTYADGQVVIEQANSSKDKQLDEQKVASAAKRLKHIAAQLIH